MSVVVTAADVYSSVDPDRPVGKISRVGGGLYRFTPGDGSTPPDDAADFAAAVTLSDAFVSELEKDPKASGDALAVKRLQTELAAAQARIRELEARVIEASVGALTVDAEVKG